MLLEKIEKELRESEEKYRGLFNSIRDAILVADTNRSIIDCNPAFTDLFGYSADEIKGEKTRYVYENETHFKALGDAIKKRYSEGHFLKTVNYKKKNGDIFPGETGVYFLENAKNETVGFIGLIRDVTERERAESEILKGKQKAEQYLKLASIMFVGLDNNGNINLINRKACQLLEAQEKDILGLNWFDNFILPRMRNEVQALFLELIAGNSKLREYYENPILTLTGKEKQIAWHNSLIRDEDGTIIGTLASGEDITEKNQLRLKLQQAQKMESIGTLAGGIAHELNTPIQYIGDNTIFFKEAFQNMRECLQVFLELFESGKKNEIDTRLLERVQSALENADIEYIQDEIPSAIEQTLEGVLRVQKIVNAMKEFAHPGKSVHVQTNLNQCIQNTVTITENEWKYVADVVLDLDLNLPMVICDPGELNQVFLNLIVNACHSISDKISDGESNKGQIKITTKPLKDWVEIKISDTGTGVPENLKYKIFDPFFTTKAIGKGTGQGLAIAHSIVVDKHKGQIDVSTSKNGGAMFSIKLPSNVKKQ